jgi:hypothetical protein
MIEKIQKSLNEYFPIEKQIYFEEVTGEPLIHFADIMYPFNVIVFKMQDFESFLYRVKNLGSMSLESKLDTLYGKEFTEFFHENIIKKMFYALAIVKD